jgi:hypothetical protein
VATLSCSNLCGKRAPPLPAKAVVDAHDDGRYWMIMEGTLPNYFTHMHGGPFTADDTLDNNLEERGGGRLTLLVDATP